jgi:AraC-like DNA-binding protein
LVECQLPKLDVAGSSPVARSLKPFTYRELLPPQHLREHVLAYWEFTVHGAGPNGFVHHIWPDGCISLTVATLSGVPVSAHLTGPTGAARLVTMEDGAVVRGARFWPDAGGAVLGLDAESLRDGRAAAAEVLGAAAEVFAHAIAAAPDLERSADIFSNFIAPIVRAAPPLDVPVRTMVRAINASRGDGSIAAAARSAGLSARQLRRRFRRAVGLTPKEYARVRRVRAAIGAVLGAEQETWSAIAAELGYTDQPHLIHDIAELTGFTPLALERRLAMIEHGSVTP